MILNDLDQAISLANTEGWNQTEKDWRLLFENPLNTCLVAENENRIAGTATALNHSGKVAWIGMVLVDKSLRGQGAGKMLLTSIIDKLKNIESIKLDATPAGQPLYQKLGFIEEFKILRMTNASPISFHKKETKNGPRHIDRESFADVVKLDKSIFGADRTYLLQTILQNYFHKAYLLKRDGKLDGFIMGRDGARFNYIGPVSALSTDSARMLLAKVLESPHNQPVAIDILEDKEDLIKWLESIGFVQQRHFTRMYLKRNPYPGIVKNQFLISGPEFG